MTTHTPNSGNAADGRGGSGRLPADQISGHTWWDSAGQLVLSAAIVGRIDRAYLSPSAVNAVVSCPARYAIERIVPRADDPHSPAELGTAAHTVLEHLFGLPAEERTVSAAERLTAAVAATIPTVSPGQLHTEIRDRVVGVFDIEDPTQVQVAATEWPFGDGERQAAGVVRIGGVPMRGVVDRADWDAAGGVTISDYKTGAPSFPRRGAPDPAGDQLRMYALAVQTLTGRLPQAARLLFTAHGKTRRVSLASDRLAATANTVRASRDTLRAAVASRRVPASPSKLCNWCPLASSCPQALPPGPRGRRVEQLPALVAEPSPAAAAGVCAGSAPAAHHQGRNDTSKEDTITTVTAQPETVPAAETIATYPAVNEPRPWEATFGNGALNPNSYTATGLYGMTTLAVDLLDGAGVELTSRTVSAMASTVSTVIARAQAQLCVGGISVQDGLHTRLRGAFHTALKSFPPPFGDTREAWDTWVDRMVARLVATDHAVQVVWTHANTDPINATPWHQLATTSRKEVTN